MSRVCSDEQIHRGDTAAKWASRADATEEKDRPLFFPAYHNQQGRAPSSPPPRPRISAGDACLVVLKGWEIGRATTSRQVAGAEDAARFQTIMSYRKNPTPEQKAAAQAKRADLIARTRPLQSARKAGLLPWAELPTINACLELIYTSETGQSEWKTFLGWKEAGFGVVKGEKGFPIWGRPIERKDGATDERAFAFFPVSNLFHAGQVVDADGNRHPKASALNPFLIAVRTLPLALPAPSLPTPEAV